MDLTNFSIPVVVYGNDEIIVDENNLALQINNGFSSKGKHISILLGALSYTHTSRVIMSYGSYVVLELIPLQRTEGLGSVAQIEHELSAPLLQLQAHLETLDLPEEKRAHFKTLLTTFKKKLQSITLEMSFRNGEMELNAQACCDLPQMLNFLATGINLYYDREIIVLDICAPYASAKCDENKILYALLQLINNAIKMTRDVRMPKVILSLIEDENNILIRVTDNGVGFSVADPYRLTEAYIQGDQSLNKTIQGLGIGLYLVRKIVELHDGELHFKNNTDIGATVEISLPKEKKNENVLNSPRLTYGFEEIKERVSFMLVDVPIEKRDE